MEDKKINELIAIHVMGLKPQVDFGKWKEHDWALDEKGHIDEFALDIEGHNGPKCKRCYVSRCIHCDGEEIFKESCEILPPDYISDGYLTSLEMTRVFNKIMKEGNKVSLTFFNDVYGCWFNDIYVTDKNPRRAICIAILKAKNIEI